MKSIAVIKTGGKQYLVSENQELKIEKLKAKPKSKINFDQVLLLADDKKIQIGNPYLKDVKVQATLLETRKDKKINVFKFKPKKRYKRLKGHRQQISKIRIEKIQ